MNNDRHKNLKYSHSSNNVMTEKCNLCKNDIPKSEINIHVNELCTFSIINKMVGNKKEKNEEYEDINNLDNYFSKYSSSENNNFQPNSFYNNSAAHLNNSDHKNFQQKNYAASCMNLSNNYLFNSQNNFQQNINDNSADNLSSSFCLLNKQNNNQQNNSVINNPLEKISHINPSSMNILPQDISNDNKKSNLYLSNLSRSATIQPEIKDNSILNLLENYFGDSIKSESKYSSEQISQKGQNRFSINVPQSNSICKSCKETYRKNYDYTLSNCQNCLTKFLYTYSKIRLMEFREQTLDYYSKKLENKIQEIYHKIINQTFVVENKELDFNIICKWLGFDLNKILEASKKEFCFQCGKDDLTNKTKICLPCGCCLCSKECLQNYFLTVYDIKNNVKRSCNI